MLNVSPRRREYETLPSLNNPAIPARAPLPQGETEDTKRIVERFGDAVIAAGLHNDQQMVYIRPDQLVDLANSQNREARLRGPRRRRLGGLLQAARQQTIDARFHSLPAALLRRRRRLSGGRIATSC